MGWSAPTVIHGEPPACFAGKPPTWRGYHHPAEVARTVDVQGAKVPLYKMSGDRHPWPARADVVQLLDGFTCRQIDGGGGLDHLATPAGRVDVVSPQAVSIAVHLALAAGRITPERADALLIAVGEPPHAVAE